MNKTLEDFKNFALKGNVMDLAVAVVIGGAFGKIVASFVNDILMPPLGVLLGNINFSDLVFTLKEETELASAVTINYGMFIQNIVDFAIIAFAIFMVVKYSSKFVKKEEIKEEIPVITNEEKILVEIRDILKQK